MAKNKVVIQNVDNENEVVYLNIKTPFGGTIGVFAIYGEGLVEMTLNNGELKNTDISIEGIGTEKMQLNIDQMQITGI